MFAGGAKKGGIMWFGIGGIVRYDRGSIVGYWGSGMFPYGKGWFGICG